LLIEMVGSSLLIRIAEIGGFQAQERKVWVVSDRE